MPVQIRVDCGNNFRGFAFTSLMLYIAFLCKSMHGTKNYYYYSLTPQVTPQHADENFINRKSKKTATESFINMPANQYL